MNKRRQIQTKCDGKQISNNHQDKLTAGSLGENTIFPHEFNIHVRDRIQDSTSENGGSCHPLVEAEVKINGKLQQNSSTQTLFPIATTSVNDKGIKVLQEKLAQSNAKLYECKNNCMSLRQEIKKAQKIICNEIGEGVTIASLLHNDHSTDWKGRSQQIQQLQQKISELQNKLNSHGRLLSSSSISFEQKNIVNLEKEKRQQMENLSQELKQAQISSENNRKKLEAAKIRIRVLENDLCLTKNHLILTNEKKSHDQQLIEALNGQLRAIESRYRDREIEIKNQRDKYQRNCVELNNELTAVKLQVEQLRKKIGERETEIHTIKTTKSERVCESLSSSIRAQVSSIDTMRNEQIGDSNEYVILGLAAEAERERLLELIVKLNRRVGKERTDTDHLTEVLRCERNKNTKLEKKLELLAMERMKTSRINTGYRAKFSKSLTGVSSSKEQLNSEVMHNKLELLEEECLAVKTRLVTVQREKETDLMTYKHMLENTKKIFQDACRNKTTMARGHSTVTV